MPVNNIDNYSIAGQQQSFHSGSETSAFEGLTPSKKKKGKIVLLLIGVVLLIPSVILGTYFSVQAIQDSKTWDASFKAAKEGCEISSLNSFLNGQADYNELAVGDKTASSVDVEALSSLLVSVGAEPNGEIDTARAGSSIDALPLPDKFDMSFKSENYREWEGYYGKHYCAYGLYLHGGTQVYLTFTRSESIRNSKSWAYTASAGREYAIAAKDYEGLLAFGNGSISA